MIHAGVRARVRSRPRSSVIEAFHVHSSVSMRWSPHVTNRSRSMLGCERFRFGAKPNVRTAARGRSSPASVVVAFAENCSRLPAVGSKPTMRSRAPSNAMPLTALHADGSDVDLKCAFPPAGPRDRCAGSHWRHRAAMRSDRVCGRGIPVGVASHRLLKTISECAEGLRGIEQRCVALWRGQNELRRTSPPA
jgi:hypothetical protein